MNSQKKYKLLLFFLADAVREPNYMLYWLFNLWWSYPPGLVVFSITLKPPEDTPIPTTYSTSLPVLHCGNSVVFEALLCIGSLEWPGQKIPPPPISFFLSASLRRTPSSNPLIILKMIEPFADAKVECSPNIYLMVTGGQQTMELGRNRTIRALHSKERRGTLRGIFI